MNRVLLFGADGHTPLAVERSESEEVAHLKALLAEAFGALLGLQVKTGEWDRPQRVNGLLQAIVHTCGREPLMKRFEAAGLELLTPAEEHAHRQAQVQKVKDLADKAMRKAEENTVQRAEARKGWTRQ